VSEQDKKLNWVERRALRERVLASGSLEVWNHVRAALQDACESFNTNYPTNQVECKLENGHRLHIRGHENSVIVAFSKDVVEIDVAYPYSSTTITITVRRRKRIRAGIRGRAAHAR